MNKRDKETFLKRVAYRKKHLHELMMYHGFNRSGSKEYYHSTYRHIKFHLSDTENTIRVTLKDKVVSYPIKEFLNTNILQQIMMEILL